MGRRNHITTDQIKNSYLALGGVNLLSVDWRFGARQNYDLSRNLVTRVGGRVARILEKFMDKLKINPNNIHILGHSLGAHIGGNIGRYFNGTIGRITGLDPAGPLFRKKSPDALDVSDANFIDTIHTDAGILGELTVRSHVAFFPNRGFPPQPGCDLLDIITASKS